VKFSRLAAYFERIENASQRIEMADILSELILEASSGEIKNIIYLCQGQLAPAFKGIELGISEKILIETISLAANLPKADVQNTFVELGDLGETAEDLLTGTESTNIDQVYKELLDISSVSGKGSVGQKINLLGSLLKGVTPREAKYIVRFVMGKLRLGIGDPTVLDAAAQVELNRWLKVSLSGDSPDLPPDVSKNMSESELRFHDQVYEYKNFMQWETISFSHINSFAQKKIKEAKDEEEKLLIKNYKDIYKILKEYQASIKESLEKANNISSDLGRVLDVYKTEGLSGVELIAIEAGHPVRMALCERAGSSVEALEKIRKFMLKENDEVSLYNYRSTAGESIIADKSLKTDQMEDYLPSVAVE